MLLARPVHNEAAQPEAANLLVQDQIRPLGPHRLSGAEFGRKLNQEPQPGISLGKRGKDRRNLLHLVAGPLRMDAVDHDVQAAEACPCARE